MSEIFDRYEHYASHVDSQVCEQQAALGRSCREDHAPDSPAYVALDQAFLT
jgi:hypothetical protein